MADDAANEDAAATSGQETAEPGEARREGEPHPDELHDAPLLAPPDSWLLLRRRFTLYLAFIAPTAVIALSVVFIARSGVHRESPAPAASSGEQPPEVAPPASGVAAADGAPSLERAAPAAAPFDDEGGDEEPHPAKKAAPKHFATVQQAAFGSCSTESVDGLSRQIIEQARCIEPNAFVPLPKRPNLVLSAHVFPYLERGAREHLLRALDAHSAATMTINSALRTVAQQYLVWHWAASKSCGVQLATPPGESNHEIGVALDIAEAAKWRPALEAEEFHWLGKSDRVHFDFKGPSAPSQSATDVLAFQKLWNKNHRADAIPENGQYGPSTEQRLKKSPADGFVSGASCRDASARKR
ncbi:MAG TPA: M15 family metallopeptidase [Polyangiaceae bacterium]